MKLGLQRVIENNVYEISNPRTRGQIISEEIDRFVEINSEPDFDTKEFIIDDNFAPRCRDWERHKKSVEYKMFSATVSMAILYGSIKAYFEKTGDAPVEITKQYYHLLDNSKKILKKMKVTLEASDELQ